MTLVWENEPWWREHINNTRTLYPWWSVKRSENDPALLAYYQSETKAGRGLWTPIKPGRYLTQHCSRWLTAKQIKYWAEWQAKGKEPAADDEPAVVVLFATTPDEIEHVYVHGPHSCMSGSHRFESSEHPTRIYGAGDLAIAYLIDPDDNESVIARAICWPERKVFGRVYPTEHLEIQGELREALHALGYEHAHQTSGEGLNGARMLRIEEDKGCVIMPYLDAPYQYFDDNGEYLILRQHGDHEGTDTDGLARLTSKYEYTCDNCEEGFNDSGSTVYLRCNSEGGYREQFWCEGCASDCTFYCEGFSETFSDDVDRYEWNGDTYTQAWLDHNTFISDFSGERFSDDYAIPMVNGDTWSDDEFDRHGQVIDGENWPNDDAEAELERRAAAETTGELAL